MSINARIIHALEKNRQSQKGLCGHLNISTSTLNNWLKKDRSIPSEYIIPICEYLNVDFIWLLKGTFEPSLGSQIDGLGSGLSGMGSQIDSLGFGEVGLKSPPDVDLLLETFHKMTYEQQSGLIYVSRLILGENASDSTKPIGNSATHSPASKALKSTQKKTSYIQEEKQEKLMKVFTLPAAAGSGEEMGDELFDYKAFDVDTIPRQAQFGVRISGDSMTPDINDGDIVWVVKQPYVDNGEIGIFSLNGKAYCKEREVDHKNKRERLISLNPDYAPIEIGEHDELITFGKVIL